jgi:hypothetical protein
MENVPPFFQPGVKKIDTHWGPGIPRFNRKDLKPNTRLSDIQDDFSFYHPGLVYSMVPLGDSDPFADFAANLNDSNLEPLAFIVGRRIVDGFSDYPDSVWGHTLHVMERETFPQYIQFICSAMFMDRKKNRLWRIWPQEFRIEDPTMDKGSDRFIKVTFLALETNSGSIFYRDRGIHEPLKIVTSNEIALETKSIADALFKNENPWEKSDGD